MPVVAISLAVFDCGACSINGDDAIFWSAFEITILDHCRTRIQSKDYAVIPNVSVSNEENSVTITVKSKIWGLNYDSISVFTIEVRFQY
jgi:hypothetical protein